MVDRSVCEEVRGGERSGRIFNQGHAIRNPRDKAILVQLFKLLHTQGFHLSLKCTREGGDKYEREISISVVEI